MTKRKRYKHLVIGDVKRRLDYNPDTGIFRWKISPIKRILPGTIAGTENHDGYRNIEINYIKYAEHRLAWLFMTGEWPDEDIDHVNRIRNDNRWVNLRSAKEVQQHYNKKYKPNKTAGIRGVSLHKPTNRWRARINIDGKTQYLGYFETKEEAQKVYITKAKEIFGEFYCE